MLNQNSGSEPISNQNSVSNAESGVSTSTETADLTLTLSGLGDWVKEQVVAGEVARQVLDPSLTSSDQTPEAAVIGASRPFLEAAALQVWFDWATFISFSEKLPEELLEGVRRLVEDHSHEVRDSANQPRHSLRDESRRAMLKRMWDEGTFNRRWREHCQLREETPKELSWADEPLQKAFESLLQQVFAGTTDSISSAEISPDRLEAIVRALGWCQGIFPALPDEVLLRRRLEQENLVQPLRALIGRWETDGKFVEHFRGRRREIDLLYDYIGIAPPSSVRTRITQALRNIVNFQQKPLQLIYGIGGTGKSSLLAKLVVDHFRASETDRFPWVYLDCDRNSLRDGQPLALFGEAVEQLSVQFPQAQEKARTLREQWQARLQTASERPIAPDEHLVAVEEFARLHQALATSRRPLLFVLDTFEEVQHRDADRVQHIFDLLGELLKQVPVLRVVVAGRAPVEKTSTPINALHLESLDEDAALGFLQSQGIENESVARHLVKIAGGHPLSLRLVVSLSRQPDGLKDIEAVGAETSELRWSLFRSSEAVQRQLIQGKLFQRILWHIHDPEVRQLAHPGLLLRRVTPAVIAQVLAPSCGLEEFIQQKATELFAALRREVSLVMPSSDTIPERIELTNDGSANQTLRFREELRQQVLPLITADNPVLAAEVHRRAIEFYSGFTTLEARAEELYHRLWTNPPRQEIEARWDVGCVPFLLSALEEKIPPRMHIYLAVKAGRETALAESQWLEADIEDWEQRTARRVRGMLQVGLFDQAMELMREREDRSRFSPLPRIEALIWENLGQLNRALFIAREGISRFGKHDDIFSKTDVLTNAVSDWLDLLLTASRLAEKSQLLDEALGVLEVAVDGAERASKDLWLRLQLCVSLLRLQKTFAVTRQYDERAIGQVENLVLTNFRQLMASIESFPMKQEHQQLLQEMVWVLGKRVLTGNFGLVSQVLVLTNLPPLSAQRQATLTGIIIAWNEEASISRNGNVLGKIMNRESPNSSPEVDFNFNYRQWIATHSAAAISEMLRQLQEEHPLPSLLEEPLVRAVYLPEVGDLESRIYLWGVPSYIEFYEQ